MNELLICEFYSRLTSRIWPADNKWAESKVGKSIALGALLIFKEPSAITLEAFVLFNNLNELNWASPHPKCIFS